MIGLIEEDGSHECMKPIPGWGRVFNSLILRLRLTVICAEFGWVREFSARELFIDLARD